MALAATILLLSVVGLLTWHEFTSLRRARYWVRHSFQVIVAAKDLEIALRDAELGERGYLLTGDPDELHRFEQGARRVMPLEGKLRELTATDRVQQVRLSALESKLSRRLDELQKPIELRDGPGAAAALAFLEQNAPSLLTARITASLGGLVAEEVRLLGVQQARAGRAETVTRALALGSAAAAVALLALAALLLDKRQRRLLQFAHQNRSLAAEMRTAMNSISQGVAVFGPDHRLQRWNGCFPVLLQLPKSKLRVQAAYEELAAYLGTPDAPFLETMEQIRHGRAGRAPGEPVVYERMGALGGRSFELRRSAMPDGGFVLTVTEITERVATEALARDAQRLQAMGQLTGGIAHDFNNLLAIITGNLELATLRLEQDHPSLVRLERAMWAAKRGAALTHHLLAFARKQALAPAPLNLSALLADMAMLLQRTLGAHIAVQVVDAAGLWPAMADQAQVESAILNLALNARDAMPRGGHLTIELANKVLDQEYAARQDEVMPGDYVMIAVSDTGIGMTPDVVARAFEPFFTTKEIGKGTGLGLAMVFGFAKQSGGHVKIYSEPGEGTTVRLYLPRAVGAGLPPPQRASAPAVLPSGSGTILVVEDEAAVREVAAAILRELGYRVLEAGDAIEALRLFGEAAPMIDLLIADMVLPGGMKGDELARGLTARNSGIRVLFMSGYTENAIAHHGQVDERAKFIVKPFLREQLARKVAEALNEPRPEPAQG